MTTTALEEITTLDTLIEVAQNLKLLTATGAVCPAGAAAVMELLERMVADVVAESMADQENAPYSHAVELVERVAHVVDAELAEQACVHVQPAQTQGEAHVPRD